MVGGGVWKRVVVNGAWVSVLLACASQNVAFGWSSRAAIPRLSVARERRHRWVGGSPLARRSDVRLMDDDLDDLALRGDLVCYTVYGCIQALTDAIYQAIGEEPEHLEQFVNPLAGSCMLCAIWVLTAWALGGYVRSITRSSPDRALWWAATCGSLAVILIGMFLWLRGLLLHIDVSASDDLSFVSSILPLMCTWRFVLAASTPR